MADNHAKPTGEYRAHQYHLVDPSPWPIVACIGLFFLTLGSAMFFHKKPFGEYIAIAGLLTVFYVMYVWWRDVIRESIAGKAHTALVRKGLRIGMGLFILSEVMFFFAFFWSFFHASVFPKDILDGIWPVKPGSWPPEHITTFDPWHLPFMNTLILLLSGTTVTWAHHALLVGDRKGLIQGLTWTVILGFSFTCLQAFEYWHAPFKFKDGIYSSVFYMATGFHGLHVIVGTIFLAVCLLRARKGHFTPDKHLGFEFAAWYWHFVDVVWLFLFVCIYWWGS